MARYPLRQLSFVQDDAGYRRFPASQSGTRPSWRHRGRRWIQRHQALCDQLWFCSMCVLWYMSSAMTNNLGKQVMMAWRHPVTLTFVQFGFVALFCQIVAATTGAFGRLQPLNVSRFVTVVPLSIFQVTGHIFSSVAISRIPVSLVHTVKALSPLFTVLIYRIVLKRAVSHRVALSLIPLTCGVVLVTMTPHVQFNAIGLTCALASTIVFVLQNIRSRHHPDPAGTDAVHAALSMLFWASTFAFVLMFPLWLYYDRVAVADLWRARRASSSGAPPPRAAPGMGIPMLLVLNGASHFAQNVLAFYLLGLTSPVTYSIASLVKRIFVISAAMLYFGDRVNAVQGAGIVLTFGGLWLYQSAKGQKGSH
ncbi:hypothetical protein CXG81DRAFT_11978 [Caulochytrium protostelioides]|uniref:Sugar phosphate transporter domain-containing protein n=1 Tax=Caulochytrium protostelioides TaxID=1555241 RepID=A0A4P9X867_9FUNG|nr:hypothetical protein CXG81DRAFT_11978 [Caulochytrium protostelioides]|eukprot:RKP01448.1 hypothetical protein CXG81DRAFT_11978 [Caulochytrium protostelioides]